MNFYISIITHPVTYGFFTKRKVDELVSICIVTDEGVRYHAINKKAAKWKDMNEKIMSSLPHDRSGLWKNQWEIARDVSAFIQDNGKMGHGLSNVFFVFEPAAETVILTKLIDSPKFFIVSLYQEAYNFVIDNEEYVRESDEFTVQPLYFVGVEVSKVLKGHASYPEFYEECDAKATADWLRKFHSFLEKIKGEMILSSIPESNS